VNRDDQQDRHPQIPGSGFEDRLLAELRATVAERGAAATALDPAHATPAWRRGPRLVLAGGAVLAAAAAVLVVSAGGSDTPAAYAVEPQGDGEVSVEIRSLEDAQGLEEALRQEGIPASVNYLGTGMVCRQPRFHSVTAPVLTTPSGEADDARVTSGVARAADGAIVFSLSRNAVGPGQTLVLTASPAPGGEGEAVQMQVAEGEVVPCEPVPADAAGAAPLGALQGKDAGPSTGEAGRPTGGDAERGFSTESAR